MNTILSAALAALLSLNCIAASAGDGRSKLDTLLAEFVETLQAQDLDIKASECDRMIAVCTDSATRQDVAIGLYERYRDSHFMGDEAVAIHIYDNWFANGRISMKGEFEKLNADMFADVNRRTLLGEDAPRLVLYDQNSRKVGVPRSGRTTVMLFYNVDCAKCRAFASLLPPVLDKAGFAIDLVAVYVGDRKKEWDGFKKDNFKMSSGNVSLFNLWDPEGKSDFERLWGVISTPKMYLVDATGTVIGRRLEVDALAELLPLAGAIQKELSKTPENMNANEFEVISDVTKDGVRHITARPSNLVCSRQIDFDIKDGCMHNLVYVGGCPGNLIALGRLVEGKKIQDVVSTLDGINCQGRGTSCSDQLSRILKSL
ncbi:MAG: TIGR03905 family TSCPD domain-containing protein, partial [Bacteroidales bacterium]|nr:TIGR03905 family TSCPD domain-containing protein [Bacteroidales bacterium]